MSSPIIHSRNITPAILFLSYIIKSSSFHYVLNHSHQSINVLVFPPTLKTKQNKKYTTSWPAPPASYLLFVPLCAKLLRRVVYTHHLQFLSYYFFCFFINMHQFRYSFSYNGLLGYYYYFFFTFTYVLQWTHISLWFSKVSDLSVKLLGYISLFNPPKLVLSITFYVL